MAFPALFLVEPGQLQSCDGRFTVFIRWLGRPLQADRQSFGSVGLPGSTDMVQRMFVDPDSIVRSGVVPCMYDIPVEVHQHEVLNSWQEYLKEIANGRRCRLVRLVELRAPKWRLPVWWPRK